MRKFPEWIRQPNGEIVPFDADQINQEMFAATEALHKPNAFLARELTDSVLHFLSEEMFDGTPTTLQILDICTKVVRELGHPKLAMELARNANDPARLSQVMASYEIPEQSTKVRYKQFPQDDFYSRDLQAAQQDGFLTICDVNHPNKLAGGLMDLAAVGEPWSVTRLFQPLTRAAQMYGSFMVLDGLEFMFGDDASEDHAYALIELIKMAIRLTGLQIVVNLNVDPPPEWANVNGSAGPLFAQSSDDSNPSHYERFRHWLLRYIAESESGAPDWRQSLRVDYHLRPDTKLAWPAIRDAALSGWLRFVCDGSGVSTRLAEGMTRANPMVLSRVALHLPRMAELADIDRDASKFLDRLPSLLKMAVSAGVQRRRYLRNHSTIDMENDLLLDRASLVVIPVGLEHIVQFFTGNSIAGSEDGLRLCSAILDVLHQEIQLETFRTNLSIKLDNGCGLWRGPVSEFFLNEQISWPLRQQHGLTPWNPNATLNKQINAASRLQRKAGGGTAAIFVDARDVLRPDFLDKMLATIWQKTNNFRFRLLSPPDSQGQLPYGTKT